MVGRRKSWDDKFNSVQVGITDASPALPPRAHSRNAASAEESIAKEYQAIHNILNAVPITPVTGLLPARADEIGMLRIWFSFCSHFLL